MANIVTKLNLNRTPHLTETNSLVFAKNIRIDIDGTIHKDYSINPMSIKHEDRYDKMYDNIVRRVIGDFTEIIASDNSSEELKTYTTYFLNKLKSIINYDNVVPDYDRGTFNIVDVIANSNEFYFFIDGIYVTKNSSDVETVHQENMIIYYDEASNAFYPCNCNWHYSGGTITGCVINNLLGEKIINIGESGSAVNVPLKCINLSKSTYLDDESIYTQSPNIPITNLSYSGTFTYTIPNGVYQFYVRYKIREGFYTDWFPASKDLFAGNKNTTITNYGTLNYVNTHTDADKSFQFNVNHLYQNYNSLYESFQIGFILSHDDAIYARAWKHFTFDQNTIKFDYSAQDAEEIEVTDLTRNAFNLYNVGNITSFKNKLYVANYSETNYNENLQNVANDISITLKEQEAKAGYGDYQVSYTEFGSKRYITSFTVNEGIKNISGFNGLIDDILNDKSSGTSIARMLDDSLDTEKSIHSVTSHLYELNAYLSPTSISAAKTKDYTTLKSIYGNDFIGLEYETYKPDGYKINGVTVNSIEDAVKYIINHVMYLDESANFVDANRQLANKFTISIARHNTLSYWAEDISVPTDPVVQKTRALVPRPDGSRRRQVTVTHTYYQEHTITISGSKSKLTSENTDDLINYTTLLPYQKYKFYVHFVKQTGEITNGYYCGGANAGIITVPYKAACDAVIYPSFSNIKVPKGYSACFFSILHYAVKTSTIFNVKAAKDESGKDIIAYEGSCMEMNTRLIPASKNIEIRQYDEGSQEDKIFRGDYYHSSNSSIIRYFGANGVVYIEKSADVNVTADKRLYAVTDYESTQERDVSLVKCTPYIKAAFRLIGNVEIPDSTMYVSFDENADLNLIGYICQVTDTDREKSIEYYSDGSNAYRKNDIYKVETSTNNLNVNFTELGKYTDSKYRISEFNLRITNKVNVYSNYNLNFLALNEEPKQVVKTYYGYSSTASSGGDSQSVLWRLLTSLTLSDTYLLPSMYQTYTRKLYVPYSSNEIITFNNTIRSSILEGDEARVSIFKFDAEDYYNIPTNRGEIVNLLSVGDIILAHTKDSMFKFTGSNSLQSSSGEIQPSETDVFQTGVSEVFGSDFGFAGIQYKQDCITTENGYIFFDRDARVVYMYSGQGQMSKLSDAIEKLFRYDNIYNIRFANDYYNNRIFLCIWFGTNAPNTAVTLSFYMNDQIKSFVSVHDFVFNKAFNTKTNCYFLTLDQTDICTIDKSRIGEYYKLEAPSDYIKLYPTRTTNKERTVMKDGDTSFSEVNIPTFYSMIDVINSDNFDTVKTLDCINWSSKYIIREFPTADEEGVNMADSIEDSKACSYITIYSDTCATKALDMSNISNDYSLSNPNSYMYPRYNQGYWSLNYFRNIKNANDKFKYLDNDKQGNPKYNDGRANAEYRSDNNSLIEGRYFVVRFEFDSHYDFKLDTLTFNYKYKL